MGDLRLQGAEVRAGGRTILQGVDLCLKPGQLCGLIGPSGAGKSTLLKVLLGLRRPSSGTVELAGRPISQAGAIGYVPQYDALHQSLTVRQALGYAARLRLPQLSEDERSERIVSLCGQVDLAERLDVRIRRLSGGQRKRVSVAMELLTQPPVLILDEPTSGLDPGLERRLMALFASLARSGRIVLVTTHAMRSLSSCDQLLVLMSGLAIYSGPPDQAPPWFGVHELASIFDVLPERPARDWAVAWRSGRPPPRAVPSSPGPTEAAPGSPGAPAAGEPPARSGESSAQARLAALKAAHAKQKESP